MKAVVRSDEASIRILHVVGTMNRGGTETWLMHVLRRIDRERFRMDFLVHTTQPCAYDDEIRALGGKIILCLHPLHPWLYARNFTRIMREHGPYDFVHSHVSHYSGYVLRLARYAGVRARIAHSHLATSQFQTKAGLLRRGYFRLMKRWISRHATAGLTASRKAASTLFGPVWDADPRWRLLHCSIDLTPFRDPADPVTIRAELGIPYDAFVVGHVGRFEEEKNHVFLVDIFVEVATREPKTYLLLVGDGSLRSTIEQKVAQEGLADRVIFTGSRSDVPRLMLGAMDVFVLPSIYEGLPLVGIEAQAAGRPLVLSDVITEEVDEIKTLVRRMSLLQPASAWAETVLNTKNDISRIGQWEALTLIEQSPFDIGIGVKNLEEFYLEKYPY